MKLVAINREARPAEDVGQLPEMAAEILEQTASLYSSAGYEAPWIGYLAVENGAVVGFCAFKSAPKDGEAEIAYATMPEHESRGVATAMARDLIRIATEAAPQVRITAQTLPEDNASTAILRKLGFRRRSDVQHPEDGLVWDWALARD